MQIRNYLSISIGRNEEAEEVKSFVDNPVTLLAAVKQWPFENKKYRRPVEYPGALPF